MSHSKPLHVTITELMLWSRGSEKWIYSRWVLTFTAERGELVDTEIIRERLETAVLFAVALEAIFTLDTKHSAMATGSALHLSRS